MAACRENDLQGAASWLSLADPVSDDLFTDSMYRMAKACLSTKQGNYTQVLQVLGHTHTDRSYAPRAKCLGTLGFARKVRMASRT
ncbi:MAG: hypothetical protein RMJ98_15975, partial [Myxococcales bacterium]|nr:hypothetical protein [Myxococcales bacterium]